MPCMRNYHNPSHFAGPTGRQTFYHFAASRLINRYLKPDIMAVILYFLEIFDVIDNYVGMSDAFLC